MEEADPLKSINPDVEDMGTRRITQTALTRRMAWTLSLSGFLPFLFLALALVFVPESSPQHITLVDALKTYGAIILSFLGGSRWAMSMRVNNEDRARFTMIKAVIPSLVGWFSLLLPIPYVFAFQAMAFAGHGAWDSFAGQRGVYLAWYVKLRTTLTFLVTGSLVLAFFVTI